jgi:DnaK suppressor protein
MHSEIQQIKATAVPDGEYMGPEQLAFFKELLLNRRAEVFAKLDESRNVITEQATQPDELDRATSEADRAIELRMIERNRQLLVDISAALKRIEEDEYGYCDETGVEIGVARLLITPTATLCAEAMRYREAKERHISRSA